MPLLSEWEPDEHTLAAIWKIEEPEEFFTAATGLESAIKSDKRRIERLAGRYLLQHLREDFPLHHIFSDEHDKPRIPNDRYFFSISHSYPFIAAMLSSDHECGIDIQTWHPRMETLQNKFLSLKEQVFFKNEMKLITLAWCAKEAAYKWLGRRGIDFIEQLPIVSFEPHMGVYHFNLSIKEEITTHPLKIHGFFNQDFALAFTIERNDQHSKK